MGRISDYDYELYRIGRRGMIAYFTDAERPSGNVLALPTGSLPTGSLS